MKATKILSVFILVALNFGLLTTVTPAIDDSKENSALLQKANQLFQNNQYNRAYEAYSVVLGNDQANAEALWKASICLSTQNIDENNTKISFKDIKKAIDLAKQSLAANVASADPYYAKAKAMLELTKLMGDQTFMRGYDKLNNVIESGFKHDAEHAGLHYLKGFVGLKKANLLKHVAVQSNQERNNDQITTLYVSARTNFTQAVDANPQKISYRFMLAEVLKELGNQGEAQKYYSSVIKLKPDNLNEFEQQNLAKNITKQQKVLSESSSNPNASVR